MSRLQAALAAARDTKRLELGVGAIERVAEVFREQFANREALVVTDINLYPFVGVEVGHLLHCRSFLFSMTRNLYAEWTPVCMLEEELAKHDKIPVAVGSGTINDITKLAAHRVDRPYMCVATAASMDGYTAYGASITYLGSKQTFDCPAPRAVVADLEVIAGAPPAMTASGYADLLAKMTAGADWIVADALGVEPIDQFAWDTVQGELREALADPAGCARGEERAISRLTTGLMMGGFAMQAAQSSRPASGAEHQFSHLWDMQHHTHNGVAPSHGFKVGVATIAVAKFYEELLKLPLETLDVDAACAAHPSREFAIASIVELFPEGEVRDVAMRESMIKFVDRDALRTQLLRLREVWPALSKRLREHLPPAAELERMLKAAGAPTTPEEIGITRERLRLSFYLAFHIRRRFTVLDLAVRANVLDRVLDKIF